MVRDPGLVGGNTGWTISSSANRRTRSCSILMMGVRFTVDAKAGALKARVIDNEMMDKRHMRHDLPRFRPPEGCREGFGGERSV